MKAFLTAEEAERDLRKPPATVGCLDLETITQKKERRLAAREQPSCLLLLLFWILTIGDHEKVRYYNREQMELMR